MLHLVRQIPPTCFRAGIYEYISTGPSRVRNISQISSAFLGTPYAADTLTGGPGRDQTLLTGFAGVDCFTLIDNVEALSRSRDAASFLSNLTTVHYFSGRIDYLSRRHFFSDWFATAPLNARDVTPDVSPDYLTAEKHLNLRPDGTEYVSGSVLSRAEYTTFPQGPLMSGCSVTSNPGTTSVFTPPQRDWT